MTNIRRQPAPRLFLPGSVSPLTRRRFLRGTLGVGAAAVLPACTNDANEPDASSGAGSSDVTVAHKYGETVIAGKPTKVVTAGVTEQDPVLALGTKPVAVTEWYGGYPSATWPWAQDELGDADPVVLSTSDGFQFEKIAALSPDLILATNSGVTKKDYETMSEIAPTVAHSGEYSDWFEPWDVQTLAIGKSLGEVPQTQELVDAVKQDFEDARAAHPEFEGKKAVFLQNAFYEGSVIAYQAGLSTDFLTDLGFVIPENLAQFSEGEQAFIPKERMVDVLEGADVLIWGTETDKDRTAFEADPIFQQLRAYKEDRNVYTGGVLAGAIYFTSVLSLPYVVDELVPMIASVLEA